MAGQAGYVDRSGVWDAVGGASGICSSALWRQRRTGVRVTAARHSLKFFSAPGCARSGGVGIWNSTGIASDVGDVKTAAEAGAGVVTVFVCAAGWAA